MKLDQLEPFVIPALEPAEPSLPPVYDRGIGWVSSHLAATWGLLASGAFVRLVKRSWPPVEAGWFSLAPFGPDDRIVKVSVGVFQQHMAVIVPQARTSGETWEISYGRCGPGNNTRWPPGQVVAYFRYARPAEYVGKDLPTWVHKPRVGPLQVIPEIGGDIDMGKPPTGQWGEELEGEQLRAAKAEQRGGHLNRSASATRDARKAAEEALAAAQQAREAIAEAVDAARQAQREAAELRELCGQQAADNRALAAMLVRLAAKVMSQPAGDEPAALAMLLTARDGQDSVLRVLALAGYGADHPGMARLAMDDMWQVPAPAQKPVSPDQYPAWWRDAHHDPQAPRNWQEARYGRPPDEQPEGSIWEDTNVIG